MLFLMEYAAITAAISNIKMMNKKKAYWKSQMHVRKVSSPAMVPHSPNSPAWCFPWYLPHTRRAPRRTWLCRWRRRGRPGWSSGLPWRRRSRDKCSRLYYPRILVENRSSVKIISLIDGFMKFRYLQHTSRHKFKNLHITCHVWGLLNWF